MLSPEESKHCVRVLRMGVGDEVVLVDGKGGYYAGEVSRADLKACEVRITRKEVLFGKRPFMLHVAIAPTKNMDRLEWMLEKCTEIGIDEITLLETEHSERRVVKTERLEKILISAMKQSVKAYLPRLNPVTKFDAFLAACREEQKYIAHCHPGEKKHLHDAYPPGCDVVILIGPEGDFSEREVEAARQAGFLAVTLGNSRLRTETAGIVACHSINFLNKC